MILSKTVGETLKDLRLSMGVRQTDLAKAIGVSKGCISLWENNLREPTFTCFLALADFFQVTLDELAGR